MSRSVILLTGASGFIGSWVHAALTTRFPDSLVIAVGRRPPNVEAILPPNSESIGCDLLQEETIQHLLPSKVDVVIHLAADARTFLRSQEAVDQMMVNLRLTSQIAQYAARAKASRFIQASSVYVYSGNASIPFRENVLDVPAEFLGGSKLASEALLKARALSGDFQAVALRLFTVYGPGSRRTQFIPQAIEKLLSDESVIQFGPGDVGRDFLYVKDAAEAFCETVASNSLQNPYYAINIGSGIQTKIKEAVLVLRELLEIRKEVRFAESQSAANGSHLADLQEAKRLLGWSPSTPLRVGLQQTVERVLLERGSLLADAGRQQPK